MNSSNLFVIYGGNTLLLTLLNENLDFTQKKKKGLMRLQVPSNIENLKHES